MQLPSPYPSGTQLQKSHLINKGVGFLHTQVLFGAQSSNESLGTLNTALLSIFQGVLIGGCMAVPCC